MALMQLPTKFGANISSQARDFNIFLKFKMMVRCHLGF